MGKRGFVKGLAAGAVLGAVVALVSAIKDKDGKADDMKKTAATIAKKVQAHALELGKLTKAAYGKIVDTTIAEYRGAKALSEDEMDELREELRDGWDQVQALFAETKKKKK